MVAVDIQPVGDSFEPWIEWWRSKKAKDVTYALDSKASLSRKFEVRILGQTVIIGPTGELVYNGPPLPYESLRRYIEQAL